MSNYVKIEIINSVPMVSMEYDDIESFKNLIFCMLSEKGTDLFTATVKASLLENNAVEELHILKEFATIIANQNNDDLLIMKDNTPLMRPSSFK